MADFLTAAEFKALEKVIAEARAEVGVHRAATPDGETIAYRGIVEAFAFAFGTAMR